MARNILIKVQPSHITGTLAEIKKAWQNLASEQPFIYTFLDENLAAQYKTYQNWIQIVESASLFTIFIACMGLFALSGLSAVNRTKEIGIRKVMGASVSQLFLLLNKEAIQLALISFIIAAPFAWYLMNLWLEDFAYRIAISWDMFAVAGFMGLITAALAVSFHSLKAARVNPINSLRNE